MHNSESQASVPTETQRRFAAIAAVLADEPGVTLGSSGKKGFGSSALQVNGKIFAMVSSKGRFVIKLPKQQVEALQASGAGQQFDPGHGRLMKEWLELIPGSEESWLSLTREALRFVRHRV
ncbi:MAG TPA: hypothetical protein VIF82_01480 [Burkholderiaceae bacterium]|jgi:TfoX/Sxy family transcriptional regulator of competence genes